MRESAVERGTPVHDPESINEPHARAVLASYRPDLLRGLRLRPDSGARDAGDRPPRRHQPARFAVAQVSRRGADQLGHLSRRDGDRRDGHPHDAADRRRPGHRAGPPRRSAPRKRRPSSNLDWPSSARRWCSKRSTRSKPARPKPIAQDPALATRAPRLKKELGQVDWSRSAAAIANQVRALQPWPKTYTFWQRPGGEPLRLILDRVHVEPAAAAASRAWCSRRPAIAW